MRFNPGWRGKGQFHDRMLWFSAAVIAIFLLLLLRLWYLQVIRHEAYQQRSEQNRIRVLSLPAPRGPIYDRSGELLVDNRPSFTIAMMRQEVKDREVLFQRLAQVLSVDPAVLQDNWVAGRGLPHYRPVPLLQDVGRDELERVLEQMPDLPGVFTEVKPVRHYPHGEMAAHVLGYLGEITREDFNKSKYRDYQVGDSLGKSGIEAQLEPMLRGEEGERLIEVNVQGQLLRELQTRPALPGNRVYLTISRPLQEAAEQALGDQAGAVVVLNVHTGEVLALASRPAYNPALFARGIQPDEWQALLDNTRRPLQNKALSGQYPPGSTFKIPIALGALEHRAVHAGTEVFCSGTFEFGDSHYRCWKREGHGLTDLRKALRESCDTWFYQAGLDLGIDRIGETAFALGLGKLSGIGLEGEKPGNIPTREWKRRRTGRPWYGGETVITAIGQGAVLTTPLQLALMTATLANGGTVYRPQLIQKVEDWQGRVLMEFEPEVLQQTKFRPDALAAVRAGLEAVVEDERGTGRGARVPGIRVAGKTGTAQVVKRMSDEEEKLAKQRQIPYSFRDHALFIAYAPADNPQLAVAVVVEHGEAGGRVAAPIAGDVLRRHFGLPPAKAAVVVEGD